MLKDGNMLIYFVSAFGFLRHVTWIIRSIKESILHRANPTSCHSAHEWGLSNQQWKELSS